VQFKTKEQDIINDNGI